MIKIHFFAGLTRIFPNSIDFKVTDEKTIEDVISSLKKENPSSLGLLNNSRIAVNEEFVDIQTSLYENIEIFVIPPSSGG